MRPRIAPLLAGLFLLAVPWSRPAAALTEVIELTGARRGPVPFTHSRHADAYAVPCDRCHHNIAPPGAGETSCKGCHRNKAHQGLCHACHLSSRDADFARRQDALQETLEKGEIPTLFKAFHGLCRDCHAAVNEEDGRAS